MTTKFCAEYIRRARRKIEHFDEACAALKLDPNRESQWPAIVKALGMIGQFGTIRLARRFPFVTDEKTFLMVARAGLEFYWVMLDVWDEESVVYYKEQAIKKKARDEDFDRFIKGRQDFYKARDDAILEKVKFRA